jgi:hypothetical protein
MSGEDKDEKVGTTAERLLVRMRLLGFVKDEDVGLGEPVMRVTRRQLELSPAAAMGEPHNSTAASASPDKRPLVAFEIGTQTGPENSVSSTYY